MAERRQRIAYWLFAAISAGALILFPTTSASAITSIGGFIGDQFEALIQFTDRKFG